MTSIVVGADGTGKLQRCMFQWDWTLAGNVTTTAKSEPFSTAATAGTRFHRLESTWTSW